MSPPYLCKSYHSVLSVHPPFAHVICKRGSGMQPSAADRTQCELRIPHGSDQPEHMRGQVKVLEGLQARSVRDTEEEAFKSG